MGAREELLEAARALVRRGVDPFSPAELIHEARAAGSTYADSTLNQMVIVHMSVGLSDHRGLKSGDFVRVSRGKYRINDAAAASSTSQPSELPAPSADAQPVATNEPSPQGHWTWEGNVQSVVVRHLVDKGWSIQRVADTRSKEAGVDIEARIGDRRVLVEVKGYPSQTYTRGPKQGQHNPNHATQARHYFADALLSAGLLRADHPDAEIVIAAPAFITYETLRDRLAETLHKIGIEVWLVDQNGRLDTRTVAST